MSRDQGTHDAAMGFINTADDAPWRGSEAVPWSVKPAYADIAPGSVFRLNILLQVGFRETMIGPDIMHCFHLGIGRDILGSAIRVLVTSRFWPGATQDDRLHQATHSLKEFASRNGMSLVIRKLCKASLTWSSEEPLGFV